ncbi:MAG: polysaccharide deacetylase family protein [Gemmatimonadales bacterium]|nr:polysaccharide deacetylase family protein [Gemmatimonadales bacterium]
MKVPGAAVLCYHGVTTPELPSGSIANIPADEIVEVVTALRSDREIVPLAELLLRQSTGKSVAGLAALTFDDAYLSLGQALAPWLQAQRIPFAVFVTTTASSSGAKFWWDRVDDLFPVVSPVRWRSFEDAVGLPESYRRGQPAAEGPLRPLRQFVLAEFKGRCASVLDVALTALEQECGQGTRHRAMTYEEIEAMHRGGGVEVGVHTVSHPVLPLLSDGEFGREVGHCFGELRERFSTTIPVLAVPFGLFDLRTLRLAREAGMTHCLTLENVLFGSASREGAVSRLSMTRGIPVWKRRLRWLGVTEAVRAVLRFGRRPGAYPELPSPTS